MGKYPEQTLNYTPRVFILSAKGVSISTVIPPSSTPPTAAPRTPDRPALRRPLAGRVFAGVAAGLARHLRVEVKHARWALVGASLLGGMGIVLYVWLWWTVPAGDPEQVAQEDTPAARAPLHRGLRVKLRSQISRLPLTEIVLGLVLLLAAGLIGAAALGIDVTSWLIPLLVVIAGALLGWSQLDASVRARWGVASESKTSVSVLRIIGGVALTTLGAVLLTAGGRGAADVVSALVPILAVIAGAALVLAPWWLRLMRDLGAERAARVREVERADIAAHLHDSVLQTLALIQMRSQDAEAVTRLARAQERELRSWLFAERRPEHPTLATAVRTIIAEVEDRLGATIETVVVGDAELTETWIDEATALLGALREAATNAVVHGGEPVTVYVEVAGSEIEAFVRDRGAGFILDDVPPDRLGVRESIIGRLERRGGSAGIRALPEPDSGTEVALRVTINTEET